MKKRFLDKCEFAARAEGEWCNHTRQENVFSHEYRTKFYITRCENADFRTRSVRKTAFAHRTRSDIKDLIDSNGIFYMCSKNVVFLFFIQENNERMKKIIEKKCVT